ncbi:hypothetical protein BJV77DRAFT_670965 [Russula vinacea]|nr:hypothetical protein BJV77DRAFT_670965 [Russula vinacea]
MQSAQPLGGLDHPPGIDSAGPYPAMNHVNALPPTTYTSSMGYDYPSHLVTGPAVAPGPGCGPPQLERYAPTIPEVPNGHPPSHVTPHNIAGPSRGNASAVHPGMSAAEGLKSVANLYLNNPGSHIGKLRMRRSRSGTVKVLILLEIDDTM